MFVAMETSSTEGVEAELVADNIPNGGTVVGCTNSPVVESLAEAAKVADSAAADDCISLGDSAD